MIKTLKQEIAFFLFTSFDNVYVIINDAKPFAALRFFFFEKLKCKTKRSHFPKDV